MYQCRQGSSGALSILIYWSATWTTSKRIEDRLAATYACVMCILILVDTHQAIAFV